ncbi:Hypothetical protein FKW44_004977, partial [Caligus rogercresseyi]
GTFQHIFATNLDERLLVEDIRNPISAGTEATHHPTIFLVRPIGEDRLIEN